MSKSKKIKFRASSVGKLMVGQQGLTANQTNQLEELQKRKDMAAAGTLDDKGKPVKPLTDNMEAMLADLIAKRDAPFELSQTAKTYIKEEWLRREFGYKKVIVTPQMLKGHLCEEDAIRLVSNVIPSNEFRIKNRVALEGTWLTGLCDVKLETEKIVEDMKCSWDLDTFISVVSPPELYKAQGQTYMNLLGFDTFRLCYCLIDTPDVLVEQEQKRFFWKYGGDENNVHFQEAMEQVKKNHTYNHIPEKYRVKVFVDNYDEAYMKELIFRVQAANDYYHTLKLDDVFEMLNEKSQPNEEN